MHPIPISVMSLHLVNHNLSRFLASEIADTARSFNSVPLDKLISTRAVQFRNKVDNPKLVKNLDLDKLMDCRVDFQADEITVNVWSSTREERERSRWEIKG